MATASKLTANKVKVCIFQEHNGFSFCLLSEWPSKDYKPVVEVPASTLKLWKAISRAEAEVNDQLRCLFEEGV